ncbi:hypothetical protein GCM10027290_08940 [Micromonospora sonneratiae]|uniref:Uncharacterized protein n=1 Tax=Micromonospora sonneratiae TaxID=1184706 RepID=A0ABW3YH38_9ACTN
MTVMREQEIARYVDQVRAALADLPVATQEELLEDLPEHLTEVAAEADGSLVDRLGTPEAYAAELRSVAGVGPAAAEARLDKRVTAAVAAGRARLRTVDTKLGSVLGYAKVSDYLRLLRPAWWILRGYLVAMFIAVALSGESGLLPRLGGSFLAAVLLLVTCVTASVWLGRRSSGLTRWPRWTLNVATALIAVFGVALFTSVDSDSNGIGYYPSSVDDPYQHIQDVYVYDSEGRLVEGARLFDQDGQPIQLGWPWCASAQREQEFGDPTRRTYPYCPESAPFRLRQPGPTVTPSPTAPSVPEPTDSPSAVTPSSGTPHAQTEPPVGPSPTG